MKFFALVALVGATSAAEYYHYPMNQYVAISESEGSSSSSSSASDEEDLALEDFHPGLDGSTVYERAIPARFSADSDDLFMRSMLTKYAMEGAKKKKEGGGPNGVFYMTKAIARAAATAAGRAGADDNRASGRNYGGRRGLAFVGAEGEHLRL